MFSIFSQIELMIKSNISKLRSSLIMGRFSKVLVVDVLARASSFILLPIYLKLMTQEEFGLYGYLLSIISAFSLFLNFGLYVSQIRLYPVYRDKEKGAMLFTVNVLLSSSLFVLLIGVFLSKTDYAIIFFMFSHQINYAAYRTIVFLSFISAVFSLMVYTYFIASEKIALIQFNNLSKMILVNAVVIYFLFASHSDGVFVRLKYTLVSEFAVLLFFGAFLIKEMHPRFRFDIARRSLKIGIPIMLSAVFALLYNLSDRFFLEKYSGFRVLAIYNLGMSIAGVVTILSASFQSIYVPIFFKEKNPVINFKKVKEILRIAIPGLLLFGAGLIFITWGMIHLNIISKAYQEVIFLLPLLFISSILQFSAHLYNNFMTYFEITYVIVLVNIISNIINVVLNILLIPRFSIYGAALATVIATTIAFLAFFFYTKRRVGLAVRVVV